MTQFVYTAMLAGKPAAKVNGVSTDIKKSEFTSHFKSAEIEQYMAQLNRLVVVMIDIVVVAMAAAV